MPSGLTITTKNESHNTAQRKPLSSLNRKRHRLPRSQGGCKEGGEGDRIWCKTRVNRWRALRCQVEVCLTCASSNHRDSRLCVQLYLFMALRLQKLSVSVLATCGHKFKRTLFWLLVSHGIKKAVSSVSVLCLTHPSILTSRPLGLSCS